MRFFLLLCLTIVSIMSKPLISLNVDELTKIALELKIDYKDLSRNDLVESIVVARFLGSKGAAGGSETPKLESIDPRINIEIEQIKLEREKISLEKMTLEIKKLELQALAPGPPGHSPHSSETGNFPVMKEFDDIAIYLDAADRIKMNFGWTQEISARKLAQSVRGKARVAFSRMPLADTTSYDKIKLAILKCYDLTSDSLRKKFRSCRRLTDETHREWTIRSESMLDKWLTSETVTDFDQIKSLVLKEHFVDNVSVDLQSKLKENDFKTLKEFADYGDRYANAHGWRSTEFKKPVFTNSSYNKPNIYLNKSEKSFNNSNVSCKDVSSNDNSKQKSAFNTKDLKDNSQSASEILSKDKTYSNSSYIPNLKCNYCERPGHSEEFCRKKKRENKKPGSSNFCQSQPKLHKNLFVKGKVGDRHVNMYRDTGSSMTFVRPRFVDSDQYLNKDITIKLANGSSDSVPLAKVKIYINDKCFDLTAGIMNSPVDVLLGADYERAVLQGKQTFQLDFNEQPVMFVVNFSDLNPSSLDLDSLNQITDDTGLVVTRDMASKKAAKDVITKSNVDKECPNVKDILSPNIEISSIFKSTRIPSSNNDNSDNLDFNNVFDIPIPELIKLQKEDTTLSNLYTKIDHTELHKYGSSTFKLNKDLLVREWTDESGTVIQIVVPMPLRKKILELAHSLPMAGHLGIEKTRHRIRSYYFWPLINQSIIDYVRSCASCQLSAKKKPNEKAKMIRTPTITTPFEKINIDLIGPLPLSLNRNRFALTIIDLATNYPDAYALPNVESETIAKALVQYFCRVGLVKEIQSDQGTAFLSALMKQLASILKINLSHSSVYHPQSNPVERLNGTLKSMLKRLCDSDSKDWDEYLPLILFGLREVPCESTGFSPFELVYAHNPRGPLKILHDTWLDKPEEESNLLEYVSSVKEKLEWSQQFASEMRDASKSKSKTWYDKHARDRSFQVGEKVLLLMPNSTKKFLARWDGPYEVISKVNEVNYQIRIHGGKRGSRTYHVNLLRKWEEPTNVAYMATPSPDDDDNDDQSYLEDIALFPESVGNESFEQKWSKMTIGESLTSDQVTQLKSLIDQYQDVFSSKPEKVKGVEFKIDLKDDTPVKVRPYPIPHSCRDILKKEIDSMLEMGVIRESTSAYNSPIFLIKKKCGSPRPIVDFRQVNKKCIFQDYAMPSTDVVIERVMKADFVSKLDATKGYWGIPLHPDTIPLTAFSTPFGKYEFTVMAFGMESAVSCYQRFMDKKLEKIDEAGAYVDDVDVSTQGTFAHHLKVLEDVFKVMRECNLKLNPKKCEFGVSDFVHLGKNIKKGCSSPSQEKVNDLLKVKIPRTKKDVKSFLGVVGYYCSYIPNFSKLTAPLSDLTKKDRPNNVIWTDECNTCFEKLKIILVSKPVLYAPDHSKRFILQCDASNRAVGMVLSQIFDGKEHPIAYKSKKLLKHQINWSTIEKECFAIIYGTNVFKYYLYNRPFDVQTDHKPLEFLDTVRDRNQRLMRWSLILQGESITYRHRKGRLHGNADFFSRCEV